MMNTAKIRMTEPQGFEKEKPLLLKKIITASFILSILYNIVGVGFAAQSILSPMIAAILMPLSSISIVIFVGLLTKITASKTFVKNN